MIWLYLVIIICGGVAVVYCDLKMYFGLMLIFVVAQILAVFAIAGTMAEKYIEGSESEVGNFNDCIVCGRPTPVKHHLVFGSGRRMICDNDKLVIALCNDCHTIGKYRLHDNPTAEKLSKMLGQALYERDYIAATGESKEEARTAFMFRYGMSYLEDEE